jgi:hypothetical protein
VGESKLSPLQHNVQIVNSDGTPTPYFIQLLQQLYEEKNDISDQVALTAGLDLIAGAGLTGGGPLDGSAGDITLSASVQAILDLITTTRGAILYKGAAVWSALLPGAAGNVLQTNGAGADPTWVAPAAGGGALVFIQRITVAVAGGAISFTPISGAYKDLVLSARLRGNEASAVINSYIRFNNDAAANYDYMGMQATAAVLQNFSGVATATPFLAQFLPAARPLDSLVHMKLECHCTLRLRWKKSGARSATPKARMSRPTCSIRTYLVRGARPQLSPA